MFIQHAYSPSPGEDGRLFPVHPDYIGVFEQLIFTEKRGALVTLRDQIQALLEPDPVTPEFVAAAQEALSGLEKIRVTGDGIKKALLSGGSPATPDDLRKRFEVFLNERCKGKDASKLRFVVE